MNVDRDKGESSAYADAEDPAKGSDYIDVARVVDTQRPSRAEKTVQQVISERYHT